MNGTELKGSLQILANGDTLNLRVENLAVDPTMEELEAGPEGRTWYNEAKHVLSNWNGTEAVRIPTRFRQDFIDAADEFTVTHNLGCRFLHASAFNRVSGLTLVLEAIICDDDDSLTVRLPAAVPNCTVICSF